MKTFERELAESSGSCFLGKHSGMSLAFVLIVMLIGGALTGAALWIVENATRTTRMAKQNALLYDTTQEGLQIGLAALDELIGGLTSADKMPGQVTVLVPQGADLEDWWEEKLAISVDGGSDPKIFYPSGFEELSDLTASWQIFALNYSEVTGGTVQYVRGLPPKILVKKIEGVAMEKATGETSYSPEMGNPWGGAFLIRCTATSRTEKGNPPVSRTSALGVIRTRPKVE
ncbi:MAG TPA: hypothetical protein PK364_05330 [Synergistaceae bacterium]|nr:hypothetical protein [Synergistaceae bacterium]